MNGEKPDNLYANHERIDFRYTFEITGFKKSGGKGSIVVSDQVTDEEIKKLINEFVLKKVRIFLDGKTISLDGSFAINTSIEITHIAMLSPWNNIVYPGDESGRIMNRKYIVFTVGVALVILLFLFVWINNPSSPVKWHTQ